MLIGYYNSSVYLTYVGLISSVAGMAAALRGRLFIALTLLLLSGLCDMYDGTLAGLVERSADEQSFGIQIDSLCDVVCFSTFPAIIAFSVAGWTPLSAISMPMIVLSGVVRLAYFNVQEGNLLGADEKRTHYQGLPVTASAILLPAGVVLFRLTGAPLHTAIPALNIAIAIANVVGFTIKKPGEKEKLLLVLAGLCTFSLLWYARSKGV